MCFLMRNQGKTYNDIGRQKSMKELSLEEIRNVTFGALHIEQTAEGICFYRCTDQQMAVWASQNRVYRDRAESAAGIRLDFHTDAQNLALTVSHPGKYEVCINGLLRAQYQLQAGDSFALPLDDPLGHPPPEKRVTVCFPCHQRAVLTSVRLDHCAGLIPHTYRFRMLYIGDSITQGWETAFDSLSYAWRVARHFDADIVNQGIGGTYYFEEAFDRIPFAPDVVIASYGTNDFGHWSTKEELTAHCSAHLSLIAETYAGKYIFVITPIWRDRRNGQKLGSFEECRAIIAGQAEKLGLTVIDGLSLVPPLPAFFSDGYLHPNDCGMSLYAENLICSLEKYIK